MSAKFGNIEVCVNHTCFDLIMVVTDYFYQKHEQSTNTQEDIIPKNGFLILESHPDWELNQDEIDFLVQLDEEPEAAFEDVLEDHREEIVERMLDELYHPKNCALLHGRK